MFTRLDLLSFVTFSEDSLIGRMRQSIFESIFCQTTSFSSQLGEKMCSSSVKVLSLVSGRKPRAKAAPRRAVSAWNKMLNRNIEILQKI